MSKNKFYDQYLRDYNNGNTHCSYETWLEVKLNDALNANSSSVARTPLVTRLEIIDHHNKQGRCFSMRFPKGKMFLDLQDDNQTLKIFIGE